MSNPESFTFAKVLIREANEAFAFHKRVAAGDSHIWPRTELEIRGFSHDGFLFCARRAPSNGIAGLCYSKFEDEDKCWEIGGLAVDGSVRGRGIGAALVRFTLAHTMALQDPWRYGQRVIAHVHAENQSPRGILAEAGFEFVRSIEVPGSKVAPGMKLNASGNLIGDELEFRTGGLEKLSTWLNLVTPETTLEGASATLDFGIYSIEVLRIALAEMIEAGASPP